MTLPNQHRTWGRMVRLYDEFLAEHPNCADHDTALGLYLSQELAKENERMELLSINNVLAGLPGWLAQNNARAQELLTAYLNLTVMRDRAAAEKVVRGIRLSPNLHPEYVAKTRCYGVDAPAPTVQ